MTPAIRINLLDSRQTASKTRQKAFIRRLIVLPALVVIILGPLPTLYYHHMLSKQARRNQFLQQHISRTNNELAEINKIKKSINRIEQKIKAISSLRQTRATLVSYLEQVTRTLPAGVRLTQLQHDGQQNSFKGVARSSAKVSGYLSNLSSSTWFSAPRISLLKSSRHNQILFSLQVQSTRPAHTSSEDTTRTGGST